jgi:MSHA biogenesis protein MshQ
VIAAAGRSPLLAIVLTLLGALVAPSLALAQTQTLYVRIEGSPRLQLAGSPPPTAASEQVFGGMSGTWRTAALASPLRIRAGTITAALWLRFAGGGGSSRTIRVDVGSTSLGVFATASVTDRLTGTSTLVNFALANAANRTVPAGDQLYMVVTQTDPPSSGTSTFVHATNGAGTAYSTLTLPADFTPTVDSVAAYDAAWPGGATGTTFDDGAVAHLRAVVRVPLDGQVPSSLTMSLTDAAGASALSNVAATLVAGTGTTTLTYEYAYTVPAQAVSGTWSVVATASGGAGSGAASGTFQVLNVPAPLAEYRFDQGSWNGTAGEVADSAGSYAAVAVGGANTAGATPAVPGTPGTCRYGTFDGNAQYVQLPATLPRAKTTTTIAAWIRTTHDWSSPKDMRVWVDDDSADGYALSLGDGGAHRLRFFARRPSLVILDSAAVVQSNQWYFVAAVVDAAVSHTVRLYVYDANGALLDSKSATLNSFQPGTGRVAIGGELNGAPDGEGVPRWRFAGNIDEVRYFDRALTTADLAALRARTRPCGAAPTGFVLTLANAGLYCLDHSVTLTVVDSTGNVVPSYTGTVQLATSTARGTWLLQSGGGTLVDATPDDGLATYAFPGGQAAATFWLRYRAGAPVVNVNVVESGGGRRDDDAEGPVTFSPSGFTVTSEPLAAPITSIPAFASSVTAGTDRPVYLTAYGQTPTQPTCGVIDGYAGAKQLKFWLTRSDPAGGTVSATVNGTSIAALEASAVAQNVTFASGQATVTFKYKDVGRVALSAKDDTTGNPGLPTGIRGSTGNFVSKPADFVVSNVRRAADSVANPGTTTASGTVFLAAGRPFAATVTAVDAEGSTTPNYGRESAPESVRFTTTLVLPASGTAPAVTGTFGVFSNGVATGSAFAWNEVGTMRLVPRVADGDYLAAGDVVGTASAPVGRFVPDRFEVATNTPVFQTPCIAGGFGYVGQPFGYAVPPVITATAVALGGSPTTNYTGALFRLTNSTVAARTYSGGAQALVTSGLPATSVDPAIVDAGGGVATLTYSAGSGLAYARSTTPVAPFAATISLTTTVVDADGVSAAAATTFGGAGGIAFSTGAMQRYGRMIVRGAAGSELLDLPVPLGVQYWLDAARGFTTATDDSCTVAPAIVLRDWKRSLAAGETCVRDAGGPGVSGAGCAAPAPLAKRFRAVAGAGDFNLSLAAPGAGNSGAVTVEAGAPAWLKYDWNVAAAGLENPSGLATFGVYQGPAARVYQRELY